MTIQSIIYSESIEAMNTSGNKKWFKSSIEIADTNDEAARATTIAKEYVADTLQKSLEANPEYKADPATFQSNITYSKPTDLVKKEESKEEQFAVSVASVTDIKELEKVWSKICHNPKYPSLKKAYDKKYSELNK